jgi:hypothetical protein
MPRTKRPVILRKDNAYKRFDSIADAADFLGVRNPALHVILKHRSRHHSICGFTAEYESEFVPQPKKDNTKYEGLEVEIEGITYRAQVMQEKKDCTACDIYKASNPKYMTQYPLCYDYSIGKHRVVDYCGASHLLTWVRTK